MRAAVHECGHAVVGLALGLELVEIDIARDPTPHIEGGLQMGGTVFVAPSGDMNQLARQRPVEMGIAMMAGMCAEEVILGGHAKGGWKGDSRIVKEGHGWTAAAHTADEKRIRVDKMIEYTNKAHELVIANKETIRQLANELMKKGRLEGADVATLITSFVG
jgi:ATP-dependent Zn protease